MQLSKTEWAKLICRKAENQDIARYKIDFTLKNVYWAIDNVRTLSDIAVEGKYEPAALFDMVAQLVQLGLVVIPHDKSKALDPGFFDFLSDLLAKELGPMGTVLLDDALGNLGFGKSVFPVNCLSKLIDHLALEIGSAHKASIFKNTVAKEIQRRKE
ncbi:MAG: hypothetical protein WAU91_12810 [Desulfatitalea sp.]